MPKKFSDLKKKIIIVGILVATFAVTYATGTFFPNSIIKEKWHEKIQSRFIKEWNTFGFLEPSIEYTTNDQFVTSVARCIDFWNLGIEPRERIHRDIIIAMAVLETGYGNSRFAIDGHNLFGIRTWDPNVPQLKPLENPNAEWGVKKYRSKCASVKDMIDIVNRHPAYEDFRDERSRQYEVGNFNLHQQIDFLNKWSTNPEYTSLVKNRADEIHKYLDGKGNEDKN